MTTYDEYRVVDTSFSVPSKLKRSGLSDVICHLLNSTDDYNASDDNDDGKQSKLSFDFAISGKLIRTSLQRFIEQHQLSVEETLTIEYFPAISLSGESNKQEVPSWIGDLLRIGNYNSASGRFSSRKDSFASASSSSSSSSASKETKSLQNTVAAGCYNGEVRLIDASNLSSVHSFSAHEDPIRALSSWGTSSTNFLATASKDQTVKCWDVTNHSSPKLVATLQGHINSVESLACWAGGSSYCQPSGDAGEEAVAGLLLSGDWSGTLFGWDLKLLSTCGTSNSTNNSKDAGTASSRKKRRGSIGDGSTSEALPAIPLNDVKPVITVKAHAQSISGICIPLSYAALAATAAGSSASLSSASSATVFTCSWDHSLKKWDMDRQDCVLSLACSKVFTSIDCPQLGASTTPGAGATAHGGGGGVGSGENAVCSSHPDGRIRLWDTRSRSMTGEVDATAPAASQAVFGSAKTTHWISKVAPPTDRDTRTVTNIHTCTAAHTHTHTHNHF